MIVFDWNKVAKASEVKKAISVISSMPSIEIIDPVAAWVQQLTCSGQSYQCPTTNPLKEPVKDSEEGTIVKQLKKTQAQISI